MPGWDSHASGQSASRHTVYALIYMTMQLHFSITKYQNAKLSDRLDDGVSLTTDRGPVQSSNGYTVEPLNVDP